MPSQVDGQDIADKELSVATGSVETDDCCDQQEPIESVRRRFLKRALGDMTLPATFTIQLLKGQLLLDIGHSLVKLDSKFFDLNEWSKYASVTIGPDFTVTETVTAKVTNVSTSDLTCGSPVRPQSVC